VTVARSEVHYVITEYGIAYLYGRSLGERALALVGLAQPDFLVLSEVILGSA